MTFLNCGKILLLLSSVLIFSSCVPELEKKDPSLNSDEKATKSTETPDTERQVELEKPRTLEDRVFTGNSRPDENTNQAENPAPVDEPRQADSPAPPEGPKQADSPAPVDEPRQADSPAPVDEPKQADNSDEVNDYSPDPVDDESVAEIDEKSSSEKAKQKSKKITTLLILD